MAKRKKIITSVDLKGFLQEAVLQVDNSRAFRAFNVICGSFDKEGKFIFFTYRTTHAYVF